VKALILGLILGLAAGYYWGYGDAAARKPNIARRVMVKFGASTVERTHRRREAAVETAGATR
jgi:hypothetical protein